MKEKYRLVRFLLRHNDEVSGKVVKDCILRGLLITDEKFSTECYDTVFDLLETILNKRFAEMVNKYRKELTTCKW